MKNTFGREHVWSDTVWQEIDKVVLAEVCRVRVAQKVLPSIPMSDGWSSTMPNVVSADVFDPETNSIKEGQTKPFLEISADFPLTLGQLENEDSLRTGRTLARLVAKQVALVEDLLLFQGIDARAQLPQTVRVANFDSADHGLFGAAKNGPNRVISVPAKAEGASIWGENTFAKVVEGISRLTATGGPAPYALFLETEPYADAYVPVPNTLTAAGDRLASLVAGGLYSTGALAPRTGLLISLPGDSTTIHLSQDATAAYLQEDQSGNHVFRVFQRVQFVARDASSLVAFEFENPIK